MSNKYKFLLPLLFAVILVLGINLGLKLGSITGSKKPIGETNSQSRLEEVLRLIEVRYVDSVNTGDLVNGAIGDILEDLDPHSFFIAAEDLQGVNESLEGNFEGIGIEFYIVKDTIIVVSPISGGPSEALGIRSGDKIITVDDSTIAGVGITNQGVIDMLRGPKGSKVKVGIKRPGSKELIAYDITRDKIPLYSVDVGYMVDDTVGYIKINRFSATTYTEFMEQLRKLNEAGMTHLMLDLRQNPGGYLTAATMIADEFISGRDILVYTMGRTYDRMDYTAKADGEFESGRIAIMIDDGSASASEILAGAIQDWDRGLIVGRRSFGKGLVQEQYPLEDGSALRLTVARYYTPTGRCIQKPYDDLEAYNNEVFERYDHGELMTVDSVQHPDSLIFYTPKGRIVYGGGGIIPDIFVPLDTSYNYVAMGKIQALIPQFAYNHFANHLQEFNNYKKSEYFKQNFSISPELYDAFLAYAKAEGLEVSDEDIALLESRTKTILKAHFARQLWQDEGFYPVIHTLDPTFQKTYNELKAFTGFKRVRRD